jgi:choice-of-anchor A domain-containing protein
VLNIADLIMSGAGAILTLSGDATTNYVINVNRYMTLGSQAQVALSGGLTPQNVLFNVKSYSTNYDVTMSGASTVNGIILATNRNVKLTGDSTVYGEVIAKGVSLSGSSQVINPLASP